MDRRVGGELVTERTVITYGTFDVFHHGHRRLLARARALGDRLIVGVTSDEYDRGRGKLNVRDSLRERMRSVEATGLADVILVEEHDGQKIQDIVRHGVDVFTVGSDWEGQFDYLSPYCEVVYLPRTAGVSSTQLRDTSGMLRLGIVGCGRIARRMVVESRFVSGVDLAGVYHPRPGGADTFAAAAEIGMCTSDWGRFSTAVDAVYIASPHHTHSGYTRDALNSGLHVLVEKPAALSGVALAETQRLAKERGLVLAEAIKTAYLPGFERLVAMIRSGVIGEVRSVHAAFTKLVAPDSREWTAPYGGSMTELGSYVALPVVKLLGCELPMPEFSSWGSEGADAFTSLRVVTDRAVASMEVGMGVKTEGSLVVGGTTGFIRVPAPWWLTRTIEVHRENASDVRTHVFPFEGDGLRYELSEFAKMVAEPQRRPFALTPAESLAIAGLMGAFLRKRESTPVDAAEAQGGLARRLGRSVAADRVASA